MWSFEATHWFGFVISSAEAHTRHFVGGSHQIWQTTVRIARDSQMQPSSNDRSSPPPLALPFPRPIQILHLNLLPAPATPHHARILLPKRRRDRGSSLSSGPRSADLVAQTRRQGEEGQDEDGEGYEYDYEEEKGVHLWEWLDEGERGGMGRKGGIEI